MKDNEIEKKVLYSLAFILILVLYVLIIGIINSTIGFTFVLSTNSAFWTPFSTFTGALVGALITGGLAIHINQKETRRIKNKERMDADKNLRIINHYLRIMDTEFEMMIKLKKQYEEIKDPWDDVEFIEVSEGRFQPSYFPPKEWEEEYKRKTDPILSVIKKCASNIIEEYRKMVEVSTDNMDLKQLDEYLNNISKIKLLVLPIFNEVCETGKLEVDSAKILEIKTLLNNLV